MAIGWQLPSPLFQLPPRTFISNGKSGYDESDGEKKLQASSFKLQGNFKLQAPKEGVRSEVKDDTENCVLRIAHHASRITFPRSTLHLSSRWPVNPASSTKSLAGSGVSTRRVCKRSSSAWRGSAAFWKRCSTPLKTACWSWTRRGASSTSTRQ